MFILAIDRRVPSSFCAFRSLLKFLPGSRLTCWFHFRGSAVRNGETIANVCFLHRPVNFHYVVSEFLRSNALNAPVQLAVVHDQGFKFLSYPRLVAVAYHNCFSGERFVVFCRSRKVSDSTLMLISVSEQILSKLKVQIHLTKE